MREVERTHTLKRLGHAEERVTVLMRRRPPENSFSLRREDTPLEGGEEVLALLWHELEPEEERP